jgi:hypothetical protein
MELIILVIWGLIGAFLPIPLGKSRPKLIRSVRFLACYLTLFLGGTSVIFGLSTKDITIFVVCFMKHGDSSQLLKIRMALIGG